MANTGVMDYTDLAAYDDHEQIMPFADPDTGLNGVVAVHSTALGPALGGTRIYDYASTEDAVRDALRLSRAMTYKAAGAGLDLGGGKAVLMADPAEKDDAFLRAYGRKVDHLDGDYITAEDVNTEVEDMAVVREETEHVVGLADGTGDPSPVTAWGVYHGIRASLEEHRGDPDVAGRRIAVQGVGKVGSRLVKTLVAHDADVVVADPDQETVDRFVDEYGVDAVDTDDIYDVDCDVFAPCAMGGVINDGTVERLQCDIVAGSANNILERREHADMLGERGITYAPDYIINAGGLISVAQDVFGGTKAQARYEAQQIGDRLSDIYVQAREDNISTVEAADRFVEERLADAV